jgi:hypothetical protein
MVDIRGMSYLYSVFRIEVSTEMQVWQGFQEKKEVKMCKKKVPE